LANKSSPSASSLSAKDIDATPFKYVRDSVLNVIPFLISAKFDIAV
jgi:hypothetical protein